MILLNRYVLPENERGKFKGPFGKVVTSYEDVKNLSYLKLITVGDMVSYNAVVRKLNPNLVIYDGRVNRKNNKSIKKVLDDYDAQLIKISNQAGTLSVDAFTAIKNLDFSGKTKIFVEGEEDMLIVAAILFAPNNSLVVYGLPNVGMDCIKVTKHHKDKCRELFKLLVLEGPIAQHG